MITIGQAVGHRVPLFNRRMDDGGRQSSGAGNVVAFAAGDNRETATMDTTQSVASGRDSRIERPLGC
jgi:hypothetical protein